MVEVKVTKDDYLEILGFTSYAFLTGKITRYSGITGGQRALGEYIENFVYGKVAEVAFKKFSLQEHGVEVLTDLDLADFILGLYLPDLIAFKNSRSEWEILKFWVDVKEVRRGQRWLLVPKVGSQSSPRLYDAYVSVWVGLPDEHLYWTISQVEDVSRRLGQDWVERAEDLAEKVSNIRCEIKGFVLWEDVKLMEDAVAGDDNAREVLDSRFGPGHWHFFDGSETLYDPTDSSWKGSKVRENYGFYLESLRTDWSDFINHIRSNQRLVPDLGLSRVSVPEQFENLKRKFKEERRSKGGLQYDFRSLYQQIIEDQIREIKRKFGDIKRKSSWFQQPLV